MVNFGGKSQFFLSRLNKYLPGDNNVGVCFLKAYSISWRECNISQIVSFIKGHNKENLFSQFENWLYLVLIKDLYRHSRYWIPYGIILITSRLRDPTLVIYPPYSYDASGGDHWGWDYLLYCESRTLQERLLVFNICKSGKDQKNKAVLCRRIQVLEKSRSSRSWLVFLLTRLFISGNCFSINIRKSGISKWRCVPLHGFISAMDLTKHTIFPYIKMTVWGGGLSSPCSQTDCVTTLWVRWILWWFGTGLPRWDQGVILFWLS